MTNEVKAEQPAKAAKPPRPRRQQDGAKRLFLFFAALSGFLWVGLGALSGHGLLNAEQAAEYFDKAHRYQIVHTLALLALVALPTHWPTRLCRTAGFHRWLESASASTCWWHRLPAWLGDALFRRLLGGNAWPLNVS